MYPYKIGEKIRPLTIWGPVELLRQCLRSEVNGLLIYKIFFDRVRRVTFDRILVAFELISCLIQSFMSNRNLIVEQR